MMQKLLFAQAKLLYGVVPVPGKMPFPRRLSSSQSLSLFRPGTLATPWRLLHKTKQGWLLAPMSHEDKLLGQNRDGRL